MVETERRSGGDSRIRLTRSQRRWLRVKRAEPQATRTIAHEQNRLREWLELRRRHGMIDSEQLLEVQASSPRIGLFIHRNDAVYRFHKMPDSQSLTPILNSMAPIPSSCCSETTSCEANSSNGHDHDHDEGPRTDGAGEPCPAPLMWQEVRENYLRDSRPWEIMRGPHRLAGRTWGDGYPLYFLNNFAATAELLCLTVWLLRDQFRCVVFDSVTHDRRAARSTTPTMTEFANDLFAVADQHGDERFSLYGAAFGAAVALEAALDQPRRVERLILQHGFARRRLALFERLLASVCLRSGQTLDALPQRRRFQAVNHKPWFPPFDQSRFEFLIDSTGTLPLRDLARRALAVKSFDIIPRLDEVTCPVMLLRTEGEGRQAADSQAVLEQRLKQPRIEWMHSAGQHPYLTHPHRIAKLVQSFFSTTSP